MRSLSPFLSLSLSLSLARYITEPTWQFAKPSALCSFPPLDSRGPGPRKNFFSDLFHFFHSLLFHAFVVVSFFILFAFALPRFVPSGSCSFLSVSLYYSRFTFHKISSLFFFNNFIVLCPPNSSFCPLLFLSDHFMLVCPLQFLSLFHFCFWVIPFPLFSEQHAAEDAFRKPEEKDQRDESQRPSDPRQESTNSAWFVVPREGRRWNNPRE